MVKLAVCGLAACGGMIRRNSRVLFGFLWLFLLLLLAGNVTSPDRFAYREYYSTVTYFSIHADVEPGFQVLILVCRAVGLSFEAFIAVIAVCCFLLMYRALQKMSDNKAAFMALYMLFPFILDSDQLRSFLAQMIVLNGIAELVGNRKPNVMRYFVYVAIATLFQQSCMIFLVYLLAKFSERKIFRYTLIISGVLLFAKGVIPLIASHIPVLNMRKILSYFTANEGKSLWVIYAAFYVVIIGMMLYFSGKGEENLIAEIDEDGYLLGIAEKKELNTDVIRKINIMSIALVMLLALNPHFERLVRPVLMLDYIWLTNYAGPKTEDRDGTIILLMLMFMGLGRFMVYVVGDGWKSYIEPLFINGQIL